jgi:hypothetical protein
LVFMACSSLIASNGVVRIFFYMFVFMVGNDAVNLPLAL